MTENTEKLNNIEDLAQESSTAIVQAPAYVLPAVDKDPAARFLAAQGNARSAQTMREGLERIERLLGAPNGAVPWAQLRYEHTSDIRARLMRHGYGARTVNLTLAALRGVLRTAFELSLMTGDEYTRAIMIKNLKIDRRALAGRALPSDEASKIEAYCRTLGPEVQDWPQSAYGAFLLAVFALMFGEGLRASEVASLSVKAYDDGTVQVIGKGAKLRAVPLGDGERAALEQWLAVRAELEIPPDAPLFVRVERDGSVNPRTMHLDRKKLERICKQATREAGVERFSPHDLRRTFCTEMLNETDVLTVQRLMGHASPETTALYDRRPEARDAEARRKVTLLGRQPFDAVAQRARVLAALAKGRR